VFDVDARLSSDIDSVADTATSLTVPTVIRLTSADSVSVASGDSQQQLPYQMMLDDNTSVDRASCSDTEGLLRGLYDRFTGAVDTVEMTTAATSTTNITTALCLRKKRACILCLPNYRKYGPILITLSLSYS